MKKIFLGIFLVLLASVFVYAQEEMPAPAQPEKTVDRAAVLAEVNGIKITMGDFQDEIATMPAQYQGVVNANKKKFLDELILQELLVKEAVAKGVDKDKEVTDLIEKFKKRVVAQKMIQNAIEGITVTDEEVKKYYDEHKDEFKESEQVKASHILIKVDENAGEEADKAAKAKADELLKKVKGGEDFAAVAKEKSECPSASRGGDLGFFQKGMMVPEFEEVAFKLNPGEISEVVKTKFGYHIIMVSEKQPEKQLGFDEVKEEINQKLKNEKMRTALTSYTDGLKAKASIKINEDLLK